MKLFKKGLFGVFIALALIFSACSDATTSSTGTDTNNTGTYTNNTGADANNTGVANGFNGNNGSNGGSTNSNKTKNGTIVVKDNGVSSSYYSSKVSLAGSVISTSYFRIGYDKKIYVQVVSDSKLNDATQADNLITFGFSFENNASITTGTLSSSTLIEYVVDTKRYNNAWQSADTAFTPFDVEIQEINYDGTTMHVVGVINDVTLTEQNDDTDKVFSINFDVTLNEQFSS